MKGNDAGPDGTGVRWLRGRKGEKGGSASCIEPGRVMSVWPQLIMSQVKAGERGREGGKGGFRVDHQQTKKVRSTLSPDR